MTMAQVLRVLEASAPDDEDALRLARSAGYKGRTVAGAVLHFRAAVERETRQ